MSMLDCDRVQALLDGESKRRKVLSNNLANVNTPGYRTARLKFKDVMTDVGGGEVDTEIKRPGFNGEDGTGNDVDIGREVVELNKNQLRTQTYLAYLKFRKKQVNSAIGR